MSYYEDKKELSIYIQTMVKDKGEVSLESLYLSALTNYGFGKKIVDGVLQQLGSIITVDGVVVRRKE
jgi:hypothetical protein